MQKKKKFIALSALALVLAGGAIGAKYVTDNALDQIVGAEDAAQTYTLTMNKDTCDGFKAGNADEIVTVYTPNGNPIRWKRVVANSKGAAGTIEANPGDALTIPYKKDSTYPIFYNLDPLQNVTAIKPTFTMEGSTSTPLLGVYMSATLITEDSQDILSVNPSISIRNGVNRNWQLPANAGYLCFKMSSGTSGTALNLASIEITYTCA